MKKRTETAPHPVTEIETTAIDAMKGAVTTGEGTTVVLVEMISAIVTEKKAQTATATGKDHDVTRKIVPINVTTGKTGNRRVEGAKTANVLGRLIVGRLRLRTQPLSPKGSAKRPVGMLQLQDTSNILLCKPSKLVSGNSMLHISMLTFYQVFSTFLVLTVAMDHRLSVSVPILLSQQVWSQTPTLLVNPVAFILAASQALPMRIT